MGAHDTPRVSPPLGTAETYTVYVRTPGQFPHHVCGRISEEQFQTLQAICDVRENETLTPMKLIDGIRFLLDSRPAKNLAKKAAE